MISNFDKYIQTLFLEQGEENKTTTDPGGLPTADAGAPDAAPEGEDENVDLTQEIQGEQQTFPEEIELAKLAIRALYFNISSKNLHNLKLKVDNGIIPFEKISDYFEKTKNIIPVLGFVEWIMDKFEGFSSKWTEQPEIRGKTIIQKIKDFNKELPEEQRLDNGKRVYWARIILNCLLKGNSNFNINIGDVNERSIKEVFRLLKQYFGTDTRGTFAGQPDSNGPATF